MFIKCSVFSEEDKKTVIILNVDNIVYIGLDEENNTVNLSLSTGCFSFLLKNLKDSLRVYNAFQEVLNGNVENVFKILICG